MTNPSDAYQRGNRDALLSLAAEFDALVAIYDKRVEKYDPLRYDHPVARRAASVLRTGSVDCMVAFQRAADIARRRARALPDDPELPPEAP